MADVIIDVKAVTKIYEPSPLWMRSLLRSSVKEPVIALDGVSVQVNAGEVCAVIGPNGAGKSTLFRILTGLTTPTSGSASVIGYDCARSSTELRRRIGFVPAEATTLWLRHSCRENIEFHARLQGMPERGLRRRTDEVLDLVGLGHARNRVGFALSSGMRARLMLARALVHEPSVLILDEPTGAVDPVGSFELLNLITAVTEERGLAVVLSSHRLDEIEALHDNILLLNEGKTVYWGDLDSLRQHWERPRVVISFAGETATRTAVDLLGTLKSVDIIAAGHNSVTLNTTMPLGSLLVALDGQAGDILSVERSRIRLQELLAKILGPSGDAGEAV